MLEGYLLHQQCDRTLSGVTVHESGVRVQSFSRCWMMQVVWHLYERQLLNATCDISSCCYIFPLSITPMLRINPVGSLQSIRLVFLFFFLFLVENFGEYMSVQLLAAFAYTQTAKNISHSFSWVDSKLMSRKFYLSTGSFRKKKVKLPIEYRVTSFLHQILILE